MHIHVIAPVRECVNYEREIDWLPDKLKLLESHYCLKLIPYHLLYLPPFHDLRMSEGYSHVKTSAQTSTTSTGTFGMVPCQIPSIIALSLNDEFRYKLCSWGSSHPLQRRMDQRSQTWFKEQGCMANILTLIMWYAICYDFRSPQQPRVEFRITSIINCAVH